MIPIFIVTINGEVKIKTSGMRSEDVRLEMEGTHSSS